MASHDLASIVCQALPYWRLPAKATWLGVYRTGSELARSRWPSKRGLPRAPRFLDGWMFLASVPFRAFRPELQVQLVLDVLARHPERPSGEM